MLDKGGLLVIADKLQKHSKRCLSYRGHDRSTCSTVSTVLRVIELTLHVLYGVIWYGMVCYVLAVLGCSPASLWCFSCLVLYCIKWW